MFRWFVFVFTLLQWPMIALEPVIVLVGPPGAGKGTFSQHLETKGYIHVSAGDIVRREIDLKTPLGQKIKESVVCGSSIESEEMDALIERKVSEFACKGCPLILDGFVGGEQDLDNLCALVDRLGLRSRTFILYLRADRDLSKERIINRLVCPECDAVYNFCTNSPNSGLICTRCKSQLKKRINDLPELIDKRVHYFHATIVNVYRRAFTLFPYLSYDTGRSLNTCFAHYTYLAELAANFHGTASEFVREVLLHSSPFTTDL